MLGHGITGIQRSSALFGVGLDNLSTEVFGLVIEMASMQWSHEESWLLEELLQSQPLKDTPLAELGSEKCLQLLLDIASRWRHLLSAFRTMIMLSNSAVQWLVQARTRRVPAASAYGEQPLSLFCSTAFACRDHSMPCPLKARDRTPPWEQLVRCTLLCWERVPAHPMTMVLSTRAGGCVQLTHGGQGC